MRNLSQKKAKVAFSTIVIVVIAMTSINLLFDMSIHTPDTTDEVVRVLCARAGSGLTTLLSVWLLMNPDVADLLRGVGIDIDDIGDEVADVFLTFGALRHGKSE